MLLLKATNYLYSLILIAISCRYLAVQTAVSPPHYQVAISFNPNKLKLNIENTTHIDYRIVVDKSALKDAKTIEFVLEPFTLSPQIDIIELVNSSQATIIQDVNSFISQDCIYTSSVQIKATYIGHATMKLITTLSMNNGTVKSLETNTGENAAEKVLKITFVKNEGILDRIFMYSVIIFITISYINMGAQIDTDNVRRLIETPRIIFLGFLIGIVVMPLSSLVAGYYIFQDQPMYRLGSFIYASAPAASASVLWTVMFDADKELALGLQIASTVGALFTMPIYLYAMDKSIDLEGQYTIKVPYLNLARTLVVLLIALFIGNRIVGRSKRAKQISQKIFRPLTMFVLLFIIVFSSIVYWYVYKMFNLTITLMALVVTCTTYVVSGLLGYMIRGDLDHMVTISISSTYRNSGISFAALVVAFQPPDIFIAYVPCLTQVVTTSLIGLVFYVGRVVFVKVVKE